MTRILAAVAQDDEPDHPPGTPWSNVYPPDMGNHVAIEIAGGTVRRRPHAVGGYQLDFTGAGAWTGVVIRHGGA